MTSQQLAQEIGILILGGSACAIIHGQLPVQESIKRVLVPAVAIATLFYMARVAGLV